MADGNHGNFLGVQSTDPVDRAGRVLGHVTVDNPGGPVSGTVTANQGTPNAGGSAAWFVQLAADAVGLAKDTTVAAGNALLTTIKSLLGGGLPAALTGLGNLKVAIQETPVPVTQAQQLDANNTATLTNAQINSTTPFVGGWTRTRSLGIVRELFVIASNVATGLGGTVTFRYAEGATPPPSDGSTATVILSLPIMSFSAPREGDLINYGEWFRLEFLPSRNLANGEMVFVSNELQTQWSGFFAHSLTQSLERANLLVPHVAAFIRGFKADGTSTDVGLTPANALRTATEDDWTNSSVHVTSYRDIAAASRSRLFGDNFAAGIGAGADLGTFPTSGTVTGSGSVGVVSGALAVETGATPGSTASLQSTKTALFVAGNESGYLGVVAVPATPAAFRVNSRDAGVSTPVDSAVFNTNQPSTDANFHHYDLYYDGQDLYFFQSGILLHRLSVASVPLVNSLDLPIRMEADNFSTTIAAGSNGQSLPQAIINLASIPAGLPTAGAIYVTTSNGPQKVTYTGVSGNTITGCSGGTGSMSTGGSVSISVARWGMFNTNNGFYFEAEYQATDVTLQCILTAALQYGEPNVGIKALSRWQSSQASVAQAVVQIAASPLLSRRTVSLKASCFISNQGTSDQIFVGSTNGVTTANGYSLANGETVDLDLDDGAQVWAISNGTHTNTLFVVEIG